MESEGVTEGGEEVLTKCYKYYFVSLSLFLSFYYAKTFFSASKLGKTRHFDN